MRFEFARVLYHCGKLTEADQVLSGALSSSDCRVHNLMTKILAGEGKKEAAVQEVTRLRGCVADTSAANSGAPQ